MPSLWSTLPPPPEYVSQKICRLSSPEFWDLSSSPPHLFLLCTPPPYFFLLCTSPTHFFYFAKTLQQFDFALHRHISFYFSKTWQHLLWTSPPHFFTLSKNFATVLFLFSFLNRLLLTSNLNITGFQIVTFLNSTGIQIVTYSKLFT